MPERSVVIRVAVTDADKAIRTLKNVGIRGEKALGRIEKAAKPASKGLRNLNTAANARQTQFQNMVTGITLIDGPLGGVAARFNVLGAAIGRVGIVGAAGVLGIGALTVAFKGAISAASEAEVNLGRLEGVFKATGFAAGLTVREVDDFSKELARSTLASTNETRQAAAAIGVFTGITGENFKRTLTVAQSVADVFGRDLKQSAILLARSLENPSKNLSRLTTQFPIFSQATIEAAKDLAETGRQAEAVDLILGRFEGNVPTDVEKVR